MHNNKVTIAENNSRVVALYQFGIPFKALFWIIVFSSSIIFNFRAFVLKAKVKLYLATSV